MIKTAAVLFAGALALAAPAARAADSAELNIIGFSEDSKHFAFEQFGTQDGSGFSYADIFVVDVDKNEWVKGTPIRILSKEEDGKLTNVLAQARAKFLPIRRALGINQPAQIYAHNPPTEVIANRKSITFDTWYSSSEGGATPEVPATLKEARYTLSLTEQVMPGSKDCPTDMGDYSGFTLSLHAEKDNSDRVLFKDDKVPASRACPVAYDMQAVVSNLTDTKSDYVIAIIGVYSLGFEGKDLRYMAVPFNLTQ